MKGDVFREWELRFRRGVNFLGVDMFLDCVNHLEGICVEVVLRREYCCEIPRNPKGDGTGFVRVARRARRV